MGKDEERRQSILRWRGLLYGERLRTRIVVLLTLILVSVSMTFVQLGFLGVGTTGDFTGYILMLLVPLSACALLLGKEWAAVEGALSGAMLLLHARLQPLDLIERYFITLATSVVLYALTGLLLGLLFAVALRKDPRGPRRYVYVGLICLVVSALVSLYFYTAITVRMVSLNDVTAIIALLSTGNPLIQIALDFLLTLITCIVADKAVVWHASTRQYVTMRTIFRVRLLVVLNLVFFVVLAAGFTGITVMLTDTAFEQIGGELDYLEAQYKVHAKFNDDISDQLSDDRLREELGDDELSDWINEQFFVPALQIVSVDPTLNGYDFEDGSVFYIENGQITKSYNDFYPEGSALDEEMGEGYTQTITDLARSGNMAQTVYSIVSLEVDPTSAELGYMRVASPMDGVYIVIVKPATMVFENRSLAMLCTSLSTLVLLVALYLLISHLLNRVVAEPIEKTNASLASIMQGNLDEVVTQVGSVEFASLSAGINSTVDALKVLIDEAERRNERDLQTAKAIQEGALPRTFPAFPNVEGVDLYASMDAAKQVGGDFYDFLELGDDKVAFLIADVSGKGIPGALFMMAAKAEIQNYLAAGMDVADAVRATNSYLCANNEAQMFVTMWAAVLDCGTGELAYVNAGHNFPLLRHGRKGPWEWLKKKCGIFLGTFDTARYRQEAIRLEPGDELILYTDGVNEAFNASDEEYGNKRLETFLAAHNDLRPKELVRSLREDVATWAEGTEQSDDVTILVLEYRA